MLKLLKNLIWELIFPTSCLGCDRAGQLVCPRCYQGISITSDALPVALPYLRGVFVATSLNQKLVEKIIYQFKYHLVKDLGLYLQQILTDFLSQKINNHYLLDIDLIIPVPLSKKKFLSRGFNQSDILARGVSAKFGWVVLSDAVYRRHCLKSQVDLGYRERLKNVQGVFKVKERNLIRGKKILIIDDVLTTGSTVSELAKVLKQAGAREVWGLVLARNK